MRSRDIHREIGAAAPSSTAPPRGPEPRGPVVRGPVKGPRRLGRQPALDGLRGFAVLLVLIFHFGLPLPMGGIGVDVFFALSGFLITSLLLAERDDTGTIAFGAFYARRARRLLPALVLVLAAFAIVHRYFHTMLPLGVPLWQALLYPVFFASDVMALVRGAPVLNALNPTWSLAVEEQFYFLWPIALWLAVRRRVRPVAMIIGLFLVVLCLAYVAHQIPRLYPGWSLYFNPLDRMAQLLLGCVAAVMWRYRLVPRVLRWRPLGWLALAGIIELASRPQTTVADRLHLAPWTNIQLSYFAATAFAFLILINLVENAGSGLAQVFRFAPLRYLGKISYGLYLVHLPVIAVIRELAPDQTDASFRAPLAAAVCLVLASASWYLVEAPIHRWGGQRGRGRKGPGDSPRPRAPALAAGRVEVGGPAGAPGPARGPMSPAATLPDVPPR